MYAAVYDERGVQRGTVVIDSLQTLRSAVTFTLRGNSSTKTRFTLGIRRTRRFFRDARLSTVFVHWHRKILLRRFLERRLRQTSGVNLNYDASFSLSRIS